MKKLLPEKEFQKIQIGLMTNKMTVGQSKFAQWLFEKKAQIVELAISHKLLK